MPSNVLTLMDKIERAKQTGLAEKPVQQLAGDVGRAPPTTAVETGVLGGTPQQQAMAGTPAQRIAALRGETQLEQAQLLREPAALTAEEQASKSKASQLVQSLGTFGAKVSEWISGAKQKVFGERAQPVAVQANATDKLLTGLPDAKKTEAIDLIKQIAVAADAATAANLELKLNQVLGKDTSTVLSPEEKAAMYADVKQSLSAAIEAGQTEALGKDRKLTLSDLGQLGTTPTELATLLGISEQEVNNLSVTQLQQQIQTLSNREFSQAQAARAGLASGVLSPTEKEALRQYLRDVEQTGIAGAEASVVGLARDIDQARQVSFGGQVYSVEELLESSALNDLMKQALADPTGPIAVQLQKTEPSFYNWLTTNQAGIQKLIDQSVSTTKTFGETQEANKQTLGVIAETQPALAASLGYDPKQLRAGKIDATTLPGAFQAVAELPPEQRQSAAAGLASLEKAAPGQLAGLTKEQVKALDVNNPSGPAAQYIAAKTDQARADSLTVPDEVLNEYLAEDMSPAQLDAALTGDALAAALGIPRSNISELDINKDGKFDAADVPGLKGKISSSLPSLSDVAKGATITTTRNSFKPTAPQLSGDVGQLYSTIATKVSQGQQVTADDIRPLNLPFEKLSAIVSSMKDVDSPPQAANIAKNVKGALATLIAEQATARETEAARLAAEKKAADEAKAAAEAKASEKKPKSWLEARGAGIKEGGTLLSNVGKEVIQAPANILTGFAGLKKAGPTIAELPKGAAAKAKEVVADIKPEKKVSATVKKIKKGKIKI